SCDPCFVRRLEVVAAADERDREGNQWQIVLLCDDELRAIRQRHSCPGGNAKRRRLSRCWPDVPVERLRAEGHRRRQRGDGERQAARATRHSMKGRHYLDSM